MGRVIWLTGESGAGKTAVAKELQKRRLFSDAVILDGDEMRDSVSLDLREDFTRKGRHEHNMRVASLARELSKQTTVIVAVIAPMRGVRKAIDKICSPAWIWIKRSLPERENHFYEREDTPYFSVDHDRLSVTESADAIVAHFCSLNVLRKYSLFIGRYQPLHDGHKTLIQSVLDEGKNVCVALRNTPIQTTDPYNDEERFDMFDKAFPKEMSDGRMRVITIPDIEEVCWGRGVGWGRREIHLDAEIEKISATEIREQADHERPSFDGMNVT